MPSGGNFGPCASCGDATACQEQLFERTGCDDTDGDGIAEVTYTQLWAVPTCSVTATARLVGSYLMGDFAAPYTPVNPVDCSGLVDEDTTASTPVATVGLCLASGTPIAVTVVRDCDGVVTSTGWINLNTGTFTPGNPPPGTVACGGSQSIQVSGVFCDVLPDGTVAGLVLVEYEYAADGSIASVRLVDAGTGVTYVLQGELSVCPAGGVTSLEVELLPMCVVDAAGVVLQRVVAEWVYDTQTGARVAIRVVDAVTGAVAPIPPGASLTAACPELVTPAVFQHQEILCDAQPGIPVPTSTLAIAIAGTPILAGQRISGYPVDTVDQSYLVNAWQGSVTPFGSATPATGTNPTGGNTAADNGAHLHSAVVLTPDGVECGTPDPAGDVTITASIDYTLNGPGSAYDIYGALVIFNGAAVVTPGNVVQTVPPNTYLDPVVTQTVTATGTVPYADLLAGNVHLVFNLETGSDGPGVPPRPLPQGDVKSYTLTNGSITAVADVTGCTTPGPVVPFIRKYIEDAAGAVTDTVDFDFDGAIYDVTGTVERCTDQDEDGGLPVTPQIFHGEFVLCDDNGSYIRKLVQDADGNVTRVVNLTLDGFEYFPEGISRPCSDCRQVVTSQLCDPGLGAINTYTTNTTKVQPGQLGAAPPPGGHFWSIDPTPLFAGSSIVLPQWTPGQNPPSNRWQDFQGTIVPTNAAPCGPPTQVEVTVTSRWQQTGSSATSGIDAVFQLRNGTTVLANAVATSAPNGSIWNLNVTAVVNWSDLIAGNINVIGMGKVHVASQVHKQWNVDQYTVAVEDVAPIPGCGGTGQTPFLQHRVLDCTTGMQVSEFTTTLDGAPYDVVGAPEQCDEAAGCQDCELIELADSTPPAVRGTVVNIDPTPWLATMASSQAIVAPATAQTVWDGGVGSVPLQTVTGRHSMAVGRVLLECAPCGNPANVTITGTARFTNNGPANSTEAVWGRFALWNGLTQIGGPNLSTLLAPGQSFTATIPPTAVSLADLMAGKISVEWNVETNGESNTPKNWTVDQFALTMTVPGAAGCGTRFLRKVCFDCDGNQLPTVIDTLDGVNLYAPVGASAPPRSGGPCVDLPASDAGTPELDRIVQTLCDSTALATTSFLRHWTVDNRTGALTLVGNTTLDGTTVYNPTGTVLVCGTQGADALVSTGVRRVAGVAPQPLKTSFVGLQSVTLTVLAGTVNVTATDGAAQAIPAGVSLTWSVNDTDDSSLQTWSCVGAAADADYVLNWTYKSLAGG